MEAKKTEKADLTKKTSLFFSIGLLVTMAMVVTAFEWRQYDDSLVDLTGKNINTFEEMLEVPPTEQPPPPPPEIQQPQIIEVPDEEEIEDEIDVKFDVEVTEETKVQVIIQAEAPKEETDEIFTIVEDPAEPKGGYPAFYKYVQDKMKYPAQARRMGIDGKVYVEFVINKDGSISDVKAIKGIGAGCDEEAVRVVEGAPKWKAGKQRGVPVKQRMVLPITFRLG